MNTRPWILGVIREKPKYLAWMANGGAGQLKVLFFTGATELLSIGAAYGARGLNRPDYREHLRSVYEMAASTATDRKPLKVRLEAREPEIITVAVTGESGILQ